MKKRTILFASSEVEPFAKTGGLADVSSSLPKALARLGHNMVVVMPKYKNISPEYLEKSEFMGNIYVSILWKKEFCGIHRLLKDGVTYYFLDNEYYFKRDGLYGYPDEAERFSFFCKAVIEILPFLDLKPHIIHCNDWQTGPLSLLLRANYQHLDFYKGIRTVFTIHNLKYQGVFPKETLDGVLGLSWDYFNSEGIEFFGQVNFLKAGLVYSNIITTVSKTYAEEIKTDFYGENLNSVLNRRSSDLYGILNGIDMEENNPSTDTKIFHNYSSQNLDGKLNNKHMLQKTCGLQERNDIPLIGMITRLVDQKGMDILDYVMDEMLSMDLQFIVLGAGEKKYEDMLRYYKSKYPWKISVNLKYDPWLAQRIYAGSDMFLMPSLFEPCGLSQMFSLRYGTIPIVRETGGLKDTITPYNEITGQGNGFTFSRYNAHDMLFAIKQAVHFYYHQATWKHLVQNGMTLDFSWDKSAKEYENLYGKL